MMIRPFAELRPQRFQLAFAGFLLCALCLPAGAASWQEIPAEAAGTDRSAKGTSWLDAYDGLPAASRHRLVVGPAAKAADPDDVRFEIKLDSGVLLAATLKAQPEVAAGNRSFAGVVDGGGSMFPVLVTEGPMASFATLTTPRGRFVFEARGDQAILIALDEPGVSSPALSDDALSAPLTTKQVEPSSLTSNGESGAAELGKGAATRLDVLFVHDAEFAARYPGSIAQTRIVHLVALANQLFANSAVPLAIKLVGVDALDVAGGLDNGEALAQMRAALEQGASATGAFRNFSARRDATGADLITLIRPHDIETRGSCGIAYLFGAGSTAGVNVLSDGVSSWSICSDETYAHEVGHNLGAEHQNGANSPSAGFGTAHVVIGQYNTVMGSFGTGDPNRFLRLQRFSNPQQLCGGQPCGIINVADNARRLRDNMAAVASYKPAVVSGDPVAPSPIDPDEDGDGVPESADAFPHDSAESADRDGDRVGDVADAFPDDATEWLDTDGDGIGDNADPDRDGDGVSNFADALPLDPTETADADGDGVGDNADVFDADRREWADTDGDGIGDNADADRDGDGTPDFAAGTDVLVTTLGADRAVRFDGATGRFIAVEIATQYNPFAFGPKGTIDWNPYRRTTDALIASELRRYDPAARAELSSVLASNRLQGRPGLRSGLSAAMAVADDGTLIVADGANMSLHAFDAVTGAEQQIGAFGDARFFAGYPRGVATAPGGIVYTLDTTGTFSQVAIATGALLSQRQIAIFGAGGIDPAALAVGPNGMLYVSDRATHRVLRVDFNAGTFSTAIAAGAGGLAAPEGLAFDDDGTLLVASSGSDAVLRFDPASGALLGRIDSAPAGLLDRPVSVAVVPRVGDRYPLDATRSLRPRAGAWYDPARSGQGFEIQAIPGGLAVAWYTYDQDGKAIWYLATGPLTNDAMQGVLYRYHWDGTGATGTAVGSVALDFSDEANATLDWQVGEATGQWPIEHFQNGLSVETQFPTAAWYDPTLSGWGLSVIRQGDSLAVGTYYYDIDGEPTWALGVAQPDSAVYSMLRFTSPGACPGCAGPITSSSVTIGTVGFAPATVDRAAGSADLSAADIDWHFDALDLRRISDTPTLPNLDPPPP